MSAQVGDVIARRREDGEVEIVEAPDRAYFSDRFLHDASCPCMERLPALRVDGPLKAGAVITVGTVDPVRYIVEEARSWAREIVARKESSDGE